MAAAVVLAVAGLAALPVLAADRGGRWGRAGAVAAVAGAAVGLVGLLGLAAGLEESWVAVVLGLLAVQFGSALLAASSLAFVVGFNGEDARALAAVPVGAAWAWVGYLLRTGTGDPHPGAAAQEPPTD